MQFGKSPVRKQHPGVTPEVDPVAMQQAKQVYSQAAAEQAGSYSHEAPLSFREQLDYRLLAQAAVQSVTGRPKL